MGYGSGYDIFARVMGYGNGYAVFSKLMVYSNGYDICARITVELYVQWKAVSGEWSSALEGTMARDQHISTSSRAQWSLTHITFLFAYYIGIYWG